MCENPYYNKSYKIYCPCRQCPACHQKRISEWTIRLTDQMTSNKGKSIFVSYTYRNECLPEGYTLKKKDLQDYFKRLRFAIQENLPHNPTIKYYACGEYGGRKWRPHYHAMIFNLSHEEIIKACKLEYIARGEDCTHYKDPVWSKGHITIGDESNNQTARYIVKYINKKVYGKFRENMYGKREPIFQLQSKGLGLDWCYQTEKQIKQNKYIARDGVKMAIPQYYRKKLNLTANDFKHGISKSNDMHIALIDGIASTEQKYYNDDELDHDSFMELYENGHVIGNKVLTSHGLDILKQVRKVVNDSIREKNKRRERERDSREFE